MIQKLLSITFITLLSSSNGYAASLDVVTGYSAITGTTQSEPHFTCCGGVQGDYAAFTNTGNLALGATVTSDGDLPNHIPIHQLFNLTDGNYGNGRSWVDDGSQPTNLYLDLGTAKNFDTLAFGRDRLTTFTDRPAGEFIIYVMLGVSTLWTEIFDSSDFTFDGTTQGVKQTNVANFDNVTARKIRLELGAPASAIDEIEIMNLSPVPVPAAIWLFGTALIGLVGFGKRKKEV
jgi:hypothetical protein